MYIYHAFFLLTSVVTPRINRKMQTTKMDTIGKTLPTLLPHFFHRVGPVLIRSRSISKVCF